MRQAIFVFVCFEVCDGQRFGWSENSLWFKSHACLVITSMLKFTFRNHQHKQHAVVCKENSIRVKSSILPTVQKKERGYPASYIACKMMMCLALASSHV
jgi:hypothetical protein